MKEYVMPSSKNRRIIFRLLLLLPGIVSLALCLAPGSLSASPFTVDQQNLDNSDDREIQGNSPIGQEFTPTLNSLDVVELITRDFNPGNSTGASLQVKIHTSTITGAIIGTSLLVPLADGFEDVTQFDFPTSVPLVPGNLFVLEVTAVGDTWRVADSDSNAYAGGNAVIKGVVQNSQGSADDLWFKEGPALASSAVPEPASWLLLGLGLGSLALWNRRYTSRTH
jgi:hypothetical protein